MNPLAPSTCSLEHMIGNGHFYTIDDEAMLREVRNAFPAELERLKNAHVVENRMASPQVAVNGKQRCPSPSQTLYGQEFEEINRTLVGVLALRWIHNDEYDTFISGQPPATQLTRDSFDWLRSFFRGNLQTSTALFALITSMVINDLGKDPDLAEDYYHQTHEMITDLNHDGILLEAAKAGMIPSLDRLDAPQRRDIMLGLELGSELNAGQLAQAENVPINLEGLLHMRGYEHAFALKFMEQILDVAGAAGHINHLGAVKLIEPVFQAFKTVHEVSCEIIAGKAGLREGYDKVLTKRGDMLHHRGFRRLTVHEPDQRALLRLLTMGRTADKEQAELFSNAFEALDDGNRELLISGLNIDGNTDETAVLPYYMPAMISAGLDNTRDLSEQDQERALTSLMRYLARVLQYKANSIIEDSSDQLGNAPPSRQPTGLPGIVIERNVRIAHNAVSGPAFRINPESLDELEVPPGQMMNRRKTSHSL